MKDTPLMRSARAEKRTKLRVVLWSELFWPHIGGAGQLGQDARQRIQEMFSMEQCVDAYDALYRQQIHQARQKG